MGLAARTLGELPPGVQALVHAFTTQAYGARPVDALVAHLHLVTTILVARSPEVEAIDPMLTICAQWMRDHADTLIAWPEG